jgi:hypothetical protein
MMTIAASRMILRDQAKATSTGFEELEIRLRFMFSNSNSNSAETSHVRSLQSLYVDLLLS